MEYILFNPLSSNGGKHCVKLNKILWKKGKTTQIISVLDYTNGLQIFFQNMNQSDNVYLVGGDGTIHNVINSINISLMKCQLFLYRSGSGNDFSRNYKGKYILLNNKINQAPKFYINGVEKRFINGVGMGVDGVVCHKVNENKANHKKKRYFKTAIESFKKFQKFDLSVKIDGVDYEFKHVWFFSCMNGKYQGGGMKFSPKSIVEDDYLELLIVYKFKWIILLLLFPLIFLGNHLIFKKFGMTYLRGREFEFVSSHKNFLQADGETEYPVDQLIVKR